MAFSKLIIFLIIGTGIDRCIGSECSASTVEMGIQFDRTRMTCKNIGDDGRSLDDVFRLNPIRDITRDNSNNFNQLVANMKEIYAEWRKNVTIKQNGLKDLRKLTKLGIYPADSSLNYGIFHLDMHPNEFTNTPKLEEFRISGLILTPNAVEAIKKATGLINVNMNNVMPIKDVMRSIGTLSKLKALRIQPPGELRAADAPSPREVFGQSKATLENINLYNWHVGTIRADTFKGMRNLKELYWVWSNITAIEPGAFDDLVNLEKVSFFNCHFRRVPDGLFRNTKKLTEVGFDGDTNRVENLACSSFSHINNPSGLFCRINS